MRTRIRDLDEWPPQTGTSFLPGKMRQVSPHEAMLSKSYGKAGPRVMFACLFEGRTYRYTYEAKTEKIAEQLAAIIEKHLGQFLFSLGEFEIEAE